MSATETTADPVRPWPGTRWLLDGTIWTVAALRRDRWESTVLATDGHGHVLHYPEDTFVGAATPADPEKEGFVVVDELERLGFRRLAEVSVTRDGRSFVIGSFTELSTASLGVYVFVINNEIVRVGHTTKTFRERMGTYVRDVSWALQNPEKERKNGTPNWEATGWRERLFNHGPGVIYAKQTHVVETVLGPLGISDAEERAMIARYDPPLNSKKEKDRARRWCAAVVAVHQSLTARQHTTLE